MDDSEERRVDEDFEVEPGAEDALLDKKSDDTLNDTDEKTDDETVEKIDDEKKNPKIFDAKDDENDDKLDDRTNEKPTDDTKPVEENHDDVEGSEPSVSLLDKPGSVEGWLGETQHTQYAKTGFGQGLGGTEPEGLMDSQQSSVSVQSGFMGGPDFLGVENEELEVHLKAQKIKAIMEGNQMSSSQS